MNFLEDLFCRRRRRHRKSDNNHTDKKIIIKDISASSLTAIIRKVVAKRSIESEFLDQRLYTNTSKEDISEDSIFKLRGYEILIGKELGKGGFGEVVMGRSAGDGKSVAIKRMVLNELKDRRRISEQIDEKLNTFFNEVVAYDDDHRHPCLITIHDYFIISTKAFIVMEYADGGNINDVMHENRCSFSLQQGKYLFQMVVEGVMFLHSKQIVHLDLKPENMLYFKDKNLVKICDFGISRIAYDPNTGYLRERINRGTIIYMPPEILVSHLRIRYKNYKHIYKPILEAHRYDITLETLRPCDVWSLGVCLYNFLFNQMPFGYVLKENKRYTDEQKCVLKSGVLKCQLTYHWAFPESVKKDKSYESARVIIREMMTLRQGGRPRVKDVSKCAALKNVTPVNLLNGDETNDETE